MESPPSFSTQSDLPLLSEDSGLLVTSGSFSSDSVSGCQRADCITSELQESDYDEQSLSNDSSDFVDPMCGENFNTVRKGAVKVASTIQPPIQFQDYPTAEFVKNWVNTENETGKVDKLHINTKKTLMVPTAMKKLSPLFTRNVKDGSLYDCRPSFNRKFSSSRLLHVSPCRSSRPASRNSLTSRLSSSHNSLVTQLQVDDSSFITQAISHDTLIVDTTDICDIYNVPFDSDIYAMPVDMVRPMSKGKKKYRPLTKRKCDSYNVTCHFPQRCIMSKDNGNLKDSKLKRFSFHNVTAKSPINYIESNKDSLHVTLREMRNYIHTLYSTSSDSDSIYVQKGSKNAISCKKKAPREAIKDKDNGNKVYLKEHIKTCDEEANNNNKKHSINLLNVHSRKSKSTCDKTDVINKSDKYLEKGHKSKVSPMRILSMNLKQSLCNLFRWRRYSVSEQSEEASGGSDKLIVAPSRRALPPLPQAPLAEPPMADMSTDFATSIQKVKDYGWYWGPISVEAAEKILSNEPDGSFIVRDSSDDHYIFTLTFKLNGLRHVRIEHDQGNFCFGGCTMFKAQTIVDFIENAVETSRSGRYLFFLNLRPMLGPVRVQLLYPVSRFKRVQSLQHMCRFMILKCVRRDLVNSLPLPRRLLDYLCATHYYSELLADM